MCLLNNCLKQKFVCCEMRDQSVDGKENVNITTPWNKHKFYFEVLFKKIF